MSRKIIIEKYQGNTHYSVSVFDSYGTEHHLGYISDPDLAFLPDGRAIEETAEKIWSNEVKPKKDLLGNAIAECVQMDKDRGVEPSLD
tara:strand:+ start:499 stop:762 length:264 start_codon:yes stop_codon:yes gene_type:complete